MCVYYTSIHIGDKNFRSTRPELDEEKKLHIKTTETDSILRLLHNVSAIVHCVFSWQICGFRVFHHIFILEQFVELTMAAKLIFREVTGDLFSAAKEYSLAHCVAADLKMGAGIAIKFRWAKS